MEYVVFSSTGISRLIVKGFSVIMIIYHLASKFEFRPIGRIRYDVE